MAENRCKYYKQKKQVSYDNGMTWQDVIPYQYQKGALYEQQSQDCGYVPPTPTGKKLVATYIGGATREVECNENSTLTSGETQPIVYDSNTIINAVIGDCVTTIGEDAFNGCKGLTSVTIPNSVITIGTTAFMWSGNLKRVNSSVDGVCNIPNGVITIGDAAFRVCSGFTSVTIPNSVIAIVQDAFEFCYGLKRVNSSVDGVCNIPNGVTTIGAGVFYGCSGLTSLNIPDSVTSIGSWILTKTRIAPYTITSVTVDSRNTVYDSRNNCNGIIETNTNSLIFGCKTTIIPNTVTSIDGAFSNAYSLTSIGPVGSGASVEIPNSVTSIGEDAFNQCRDLTSVTIPNSVTTIGKEAFMYCVSLTSIGSVGSGASVEIPDSVTSIGHYAFQECSGLTSIDIPSGVTSIGAIAFHNCGSLTSVNIPNSVTSIGDYAFQHCSSLTSVTVNTTTPPTLGGTYVFNDTNNCPIYVPASSVNAYKTATNWSRYASRIQAIP